MLCCHRSDTSGGGELVGGFVFGECRLGITPLFRDLSKVKVCRGEVFVLRQNLTEKTLCLFQLILFEKCPGEQIFGGI